MEIPSVAGSRFGKNKKVNTGAVRAPPFQKKVRHVASWGLVESSGVAS
jgi:hypothetical protein